MNQLTKDEKEIIVDKMKYYVKTYSAELFLDEESFIKDMIYLTGTSLSNKYKFSSGFNSFCKRLKLILE